MCGLLVTKLRPLSNCRHCSYTLSHDSVWFSNCTCNVLRFFSKLQPFTRNLIKHCCAFSTSTLLTLIAIHQQLASDAIYSSWIWEQLTEVACIVRTFVLLIHKCLGEILTILKNSFPCVWAADKLSVKIFNICECVSSNYLLYCLFIILQYRVYWF